MVHFLKLTTRILNASRIIKIENVNNVYNIHMLNNKIEGMGSLIFFGVNTKKDDIIQICKEDNPDDFSKITKWIYRLDS